MAAAPPLLRSAQGEAMWARAFPYGGWPGRLASCSRVAGQTVELTSLGMLDPRPLRAMLPQSEMVAKKGQALNTEQLWQEFFLDPSQWWDNRFDKKGPRSPDFRHKHTKEVLWIEGWSNPPWVKAKLAAVIEGQPQSGGGFSLHAQHGVPHRQYNRMNVAESFESSTSTMIPSFERGPRETVNETSSGICGNVRTLCKAGKVKEALHILHQQGISADSNTYVSLLQECIKFKDLGSGKQVHAHIIQTGFKPNNFLLNTLVNMYTKCGKVVDARQVFDKMPERDVFTCTIMMAGYNKHGCGMDAFEIYEKMIQEGVMPNMVTFTCVLNACASLGSVERGKRVHADISKSGIVPDIILENTLVDMYAKCGSVNDARQVFNNIATRDVVSWNVMIAGYGQHGCSKEAFGMYEQMKQEGMMPDKVTFICILNSCASLGALEKGKEVHADIIKAGITGDIILDTALADMYAKCRSMKDARQVFRSMAQQDVVTWSAMIAGYAQDGCAGEAFETYVEMQRRGVMPDRVTFICVLNACASLGDLEKGKEVHADIIQAKIVPDLVLETALVEMYAKCGSMKDARQVFDCMAQQDVVSWSAIITGYAQHGFGSEALEIYARMQREGLMPDKVTFICVLCACASLSALDKGKEVHSDIVKAGIQPDVILDTALVEMYAKCGSMKEARHVFNNMDQRDVVSWSAMIAGYAQHGCAPEAIQLFEQMQQEGLKPDGITFVGLLSACSHVGLVDEGRHYFNSMSQDHGLTPTVEHFGCMVDLLGRAGRLDEAEDFISKLSIKPDASLWGALLGACRNHDDVQRAERVAKRILETD